MHMRVEMSTRHPSGPSLAKLTTQIGDKAQDIPTGCDLTGALALILQWQPKHSGGSGV